MPPKNLIGKIKSVSCRNFVTYEECTFKPNEFLNVIIGPNGTGKSTLVAAIVIGLGGDPKLLNRSISIKDYVKNGKTEAATAIEIYKSNNKTSTVLLERSFSLTGKSEFKVDGESMSKANFLAAVLNFKIQIGNLCQFLPQDRVHDFAKMNPQELFTNTIESVCNQAELLKFEQLKSLRSEQSTRKEKLERDTQNLRTITARLDELKVVLERYTQRKEYMDQLKVCVAKQTWLEVQDFEEKLKAQSLDKIEAEKLLQKTEKEYNTIKRKQDAVTQTKTQLRNDTQQKRSIVNRLLEECNDISKKIEELTMQIKNAKRSLDRSKREYETSFEEMKTESAILEGIQQDLMNIKNQHGSIQTLKSQLLPFDKRILDFRNEISKRMKKCSIINDRLDEQYTSHIQMLKNRIERVHNVRDVKLQLLKKNYPKLFDAVQWVQDQQRQNRFIGKVYNPMLLELNVKSSNYAKYAENTIQNRDLLAFTCENKTDMSLIVNELCVKKKLGINVLYSPPADTCNFKAKTPIQHLSQYGFETYLIDTIEGPASIINYLCSLYSIHQIPIGGEHVNQCTDRIPTSIRLYYGSNQRYECTISRYSGEASLMQIPFESKQLLYSVNTEQVENMKKELSKLLYESDALKNECTKIQSEIKDIEVKHEEVRNEKRKIESKLLSIKETIGRFERQQQKIERLKKDIIDIPEAEKQFLSNTSNTIRNLLELHKKLVTSLGAYQNAVAKKKLADLKQSVYNQQSEDLESQLRDISERKRSVRKTYDNILCATATTEKRLEEKIIQAKANTNGLSPHDKNFPFKSEFRKLPESLTELKENINEFNARLECMTDVDENAIKEFEDKTSQIDVLKHSINVIKTQENDIQEQICTIFNDWFSSVERIVEILNEQFSHFMSSMSFVGEISLSRKDDYDFDSYGIQIMVQYRKEVPLQALNRYTQSGGERAVAIAVYSLSLQHITHVPFRCVDEINQGMDPRNERKIFEMLVEETTKNERSQYFFVTPKLLPGLVHNKRMMVHIVFNGKFVKPGGFI